MGEGLTKCASVLEQSGDTIEEASGMIVGGGSITQDFTAMGNALKIYTLRLHGMKGKLEELGEDVDENVESISKMQTQLLNLTHGKVNIFDDNGNFKKTYEITKEIAEIYDDLSDTDRASLLEVIAGKNRSNQIQALIRNWDEVEKATNAAFNSAGTAAKEQEKYMNSLQGKLDAFQATWQALSNTFFDSSFLKGLVDFGSGFLNVLDKIMDTLHVLPTLAIAFAGALSFKNIGKNRMFFLNVKCADNDCVFY